MKKIIYLNIFLFCFLYIPISVNAKKIPNLIGKWQGENIQSTVKNGFVKSFLMVAFDLNKRCIVINISYK